MDSDEDDEYLSDPKNLMLLVVGMVWQRLKDLRVECGLTLEQLAEQTRLSKSALGSYAAEDFKDISHYAIIRLAKFYGVTADYLPGLSETKNHPNADLADRRGNC